MGREPVSSAGARHREGAAPLAGWWDFTNVRPGSGSVVDEVKVGPSGIYVCRHARNASAVDDRDGALCSQAASAGEAAVAVVALLPTRYRHVVRAGVCVCAATDDGRLVESVPVQSPDAWQHTHAHAPRVLSTSEVAELARLLGDRLEHVVPAPAPAVRRDLWRPLRWAVAAASVAAVVAGATVARTPWW